MLIGISHIWKSFGISTKSARLYIMLSLLYKILLTCNIYQRELEAEEEKYSAGIINYNYFYTTRM